MNKVFLAPVTSGCLAIVALALVLRSSPGSFTGLDEFMFRVAHYMGQLVFAITGACLGRRLAANQGTNGTYAGVSGSLLAMATLAAAYWLVVASVMFVSARHFRATWQAEYWWGLYAGWCGHVAMGAVAAALATIGSVPLAALTALAFRAELLPKIAYPMRLVLPRYSYFLRLSGFSDSSAIWPASDAVWATLYAAAIVCAAFGLERIKARWRRPAAINA